MPLSKLQFNPGINREITRYTNEAGWYEGDKIRFRQGYPEKIGGWQRLGENTFTGVCRSLHQWISLEFARYTGLGTNVKFMVETGQNYYDITPLRTTATLSGPFTTNTTGGTEAIVTVAHSSHGATVGSYVTFSGSGAVGGVPAGDFNKEHTITEVIDANSYKITVSTSATSVATGGGSVTAAYQINVGPDFQIPTLGWESNPFGEGTWNGDALGSESLRVWNQANYGEDLIIGPRGGELYYWDTSASTSNTVPDGTRAVTLKDVNNGTAVTLGTNPFTTVNTSPTVTVADATGSRVYEVGQHVTFANAGTVNNIALDARFKIQTVDSAANTFTITGGTNANSSGSGGGSSVTAQYELSAEVPVVQDGLLVSDASRFVFAFGCNAFGDSTEAQNPLLIRWSDQEDAYDWRPRSTNQAGDLQLSQGTEIVSAIQSRQEILVFTDSSVYSLQYVGAPVVWSSQLVGSNISVASSKAVAYANGVVYWMGKEKFYMYDGTVQPLKCDVRKYIFDDLDTGQYEQVFAGTLEEYHEVWWFYCDSQRVAPNKYVVYNYLEGIWYYGTMDRSAWYDSPINDFPIAATDTYNLVEHENGNDDGQAATTVAIDAHITSGQFSIESGNSFAFIDKVLPDVTFLGSTENSPVVTMTIYGADDSGSGYTDTGSGSTERSNAVDLTVEEYTSQINTRVRGRQIALKVSSNGKGVAWQLGTPRINMRPDGRRGG